MKRIPKSTNTANKRYATVCVRVAVRQRAILAVWFAMANTTTSEDLRAYIENTIKEVGQCVAKLSVNEQKTFWADVEREQEHIAAMMELKQLARRRKAIGIGRGGRAREIQRRLRESRRAAA